MRALTAWEIARYVAHLVVRDTYLIGRLSTDSTKGLAADHTAALMVEGRLFGGPKVKARA
jgi:hypothetical protein